MRHAPLAAAALLLAFAAGLSAEAQPAAAPPAAAPPATVATVSANLNITPRRVTFDKNRRVASIYIFNQGNGPGTFDISLIDRVMLPDGQIVSVDDAKTKPELKDEVERLKSAKDVLQVSPRRATLAPGQGQTVRLRLASVPQGASGEYRSHLTITTIPAPSAGLTAEQIASGQRGELSFQISTVFGISIPAIVRFSDPDVKAQISNAHVEFDQIAQPGGAPKRTPVMVFDLERLGASSLFGNVEIRSLGHKGAPLGLVRGLGVYTEIAKRTVRVPLTRDPTSGEHLEITFTDDDTSPGKLLAKLDT
jgi:P pilus assembly chaperone PapD